MPKFDLNGFDFLKDAFNAFAGKHDASEMKARVARSLAAGGKSAIDKATQEFPKAEIKEIVADLYNVVTSQQLADSLSGLVRGFDEEKVQQVLDQVVSQLRDPETSEKIATGLKDLLSKVPLDQLIESIDGLCSSLPLAQRIMVEALVRQLTPILEDIKDASPEQAAEKVRDLAEMIPTDMLAMYAGEITRRVSPEAISQQAHALVGKLPSPNAIAEIAHGVAGAISAKLEEASNAATVADVTAAFSGINAATKKIIEDTIANDNQSKGNFNKKGGGKFKL